MAKKIVALGGTTSRSRRRTKKAAGPIANEIKSVIGGAHVGWSLYVEDYDRAVKAMSDVIYSKVLSSGDAPANCAVAALAAIGIKKPA